MTPAQIAKEALAQQARQLASKLAEAASDPDERKTYGQGPFIVRLDGCTTFPKPQCASSHSHTHTFVLTYFFIYGQLAPW